MTRVYPRKGKIRDVKNLKWFFREAGKNIVQSITMIENPGHGWVMEAVFKHGLSEDPGARFVTDFASLDVFKETMGRSRNVRGVLVVVEHNDGTTDTFVIGEDRQSAKQRKKIDAALNAVARRL